MQHESHLFYRRCRSNQYQPVILLAILRKYPRTIPLLAYDASTYCRRPRRCSTYHELQLVSSFALSWDVLKSANKVSLHEAMAAISLYLILTSITFCHTPSLQAPATPRSCVEKSLIFRASSISRHMSPFSILHYLNHHFHF